MKILKYVLFGIGGIVALILITALFVKSDFEIVREVTINKPKAEVFNYIKLVKNQDNYSKWNKTDPGMKKEYKGTDGTVGFVYSWDSNNENVGKGEQEIKNITEGERIDMDLRFKKPMESQSTAYMTTEAVGENQTKTKWAFKGKIPYPFNIMCLFMNMDAAVGADLQTGLDNLKVELEK
ncbi:MAG: SRPBCC family protein [Cytophagaceae bacterium]